MSKMNINKRNWMKKKVRTKKSLGELGKYPRLIVYKSNKHFYTQLLDDNSSSTICSSSSKDKKLAKLFDKALTKTEISKQIGYDIAKKISENNMNQVIFDRNGYKFHGRIKAFVDAVKEKGIKI